VKMGINNMHIGVLSFAQTGRISVNDV
jgi:hypothetical protein